MARREVKSDVTGTVRSIETGPGTEISKGNSLLILESMKMEIMVVAPIDGKIVEICVNVDEFVDEGRVLVVLDV